MIETLSNNINERRQARDLTQEELACAVGVSRQTIIAIEKGNYTPSLLLALKLANFFSTKGGSASGGKKLSIEDIFWIN